MSHHGKETDHDFGIQAGVLGATGEHPRGKLTPDDEGAIAFAIGDQDGKVVIKFGTPVAWMGMTPEEAVTLAELLIKRARAVSKVPLKVEI